MAAKLLDANGKLKPFRQWLDDVSSISTHHCGAWLRTEYDTAVIRAHNAADWQSFLRNKDVMPNLRWMPTTSPNPESSHEAYWKAKLTLPVDDPFWSKHHPGDRWNCKCSLEQTDDPVNRPDDLDGVDPPQRGLENNPGKDGQTFSDNHPYYPDSCSVCPFNKGSFKNHLHSFFHNHKKGKNCNNCPRINSALPKKKMKIDMKEEKKSVSELLKGLHDKKGSEYVKTLKEITYSNEFKPVPKLKNVYSMIDESDKDYFNIIQASKRAVEHGNTVYILPNPHSTRKPDFIFVRNGIYKAYDLKTIFGKNSVDDRLFGSIGQTRRVLLRMAVQYNAENLANSIKSYFEINSKALEVLIYKGNKQISVIRDEIGKNFVKAFKTRYYK